jgi:hypothetical protein
MSRGNEMRKRFWTLAHFALTLGCIGCCVYLFDRDLRREIEQKERTLEHTDFALRQFHQVRWLGGDYALPSGQDHCAITILRFEDGKYKERFGSWAWSASSGESRTIPYMVMWGPTADGTQSLVKSGAFSMPGVQNKWFANLDGITGRSYGVSDLGELRGYRVIGFAGSKEPRAGRDQPKAFSSEIDSLIENHKHVGFLVVKHCSSEEEAKQIAHGRPEPEDP